MAVVLCGVGIGQREHFQYSRADIGQFSADEPALAEVELRLIDEPRVTSSSLAETRHLPPKLAMSAEVLRVKTWNGWVDAGGELPIVVNQIDAQLNAGQVVRMAGLLQRPVAAASPGEFDWAGYYREQRILTTLVVSRIGNINVIGEGSPAPLEWLRMKASHLLATGFSSQRAVEHALLGALVLGERDPAMANVEDEFRKTGVAYQLHVSGMHVAVLAGLVLLACRIALLPPRLSMVMTELFVVLYGLMAMPSHSGIRWVIFCSAVFLARWARRPTERFQMLALCVVAMLVYHPMDLYSPGFQLSFVAVFALAVFMGPLVEFTHSFKDQDLLLAPQASEVGWVKRARRWVVGIALMEVVVGMAVLPVLLYQQGQVNPWSFLGAFVLLPVVLISLVGGCVKLMGTLLWPSAAGILAMVAGWPIVLMQHMVNLLVKLPGGKVAVAAPRVWLIVVYYLLCILPLLPPTTFLRGRRRWILRTGPITAVMAILILPAFLNGVRLVAPSSGLRMTLLAVGAGQCAVIEPTAGGVSFVDAGSSSISDVVGKVVSPFLRTRGDRLVEDIFLSHGDYDHISGAGEIATVYGVHDVFISPHFRRNAAGNLPDQVMLETFGKMDVTPGLINLGDHVDLPDKVGIDVLWPPAEGEWNSNNAGLVLRLRYAGRTILFPADIQDSAFAGLLKHPEELKADVLVAPHHGSSETLTAAFVHAVNPQVILSSNAWILTSKQKRFDKIVENIPLYRTNKFGSITVSISPAGEISISTFLKGGAAQAVDTLAADRR